ncbi:hypothetical protein GCM10007973_11280 [Polymorphobacter multimanifer]|uniref:histidine kinase n=2 Tax=Polymorphobacter multimanifer TaxID=1070431 RepID=A0A841L097_9SPHN|nr:HWE histidine kinase domain-containing protein [Polymorphobacter multimanifer]MBB6226097.1 two-component sensor histidine kinase [Polymorphobacter multimanifer]GGI76217.1 hypothetical protein GCM10007973_11280 [Polymorphobacter multimanifer]
MFDALPEIAWVATDGGQHWHFNARWHAHTGLDAAACAGSDWLQAVHTDDREALGSGWQASMASGAPFEQSFRLRRHNSQYGWVLARAAFDIGTARWIGTAVDIDAIKSSESQATLLARELAHRIGNIFAVVGSVIAFSARSRPEAKDFAASAKARLAALAQAHEYAWPMTGANEAAPVRLQGLLELLLRPYAETDGPEVTITGVDAPLGPSTSTFVTLVVHELATNAVKYGALSSPQGRIAVRVRQSAEHLTLMWVESGGPPITAAPGQQGFGTALIDRAMKMGLASETQRRWRRRGLAIKLRLNVAPLAR